MITKQLYNDVYQMPFDGYPMNVGMPRSAVANETPACIPTVERGKAAIVKKLIIGVQGNLDTSPSSPGSASGTAVGVANLLFGIAGSTKISLPFLGFARLPTLGAADEQALPCVPTTWEPKGQIVVPETWDLRSQPATTSGGGIGVVYFMRETAEAKVLGYDCGIQPLQADRNWIVAGSALPTTAAVVLGAARTGYSIHVTDILIRLQPQNVTATVSVQDTNNSNIFIFKHDTRTEPGQIILKTDLYLPNDLGVQAVASANAAGHATITLLGRYVKNIDKPSDAWYSFIQPIKPSPGTTGDGFGNRVATTIKAAPGKGLRHICNGWAMSMSRTGTVAGDQVAFAITVGTAGATFGAGATAIGPGNNALSPVLLLGSQNHTIHASLDEVNVPCPENQAILFEARSILSPSNTEAEIDGWGVLVWGRTRPAWGNPTLTANFTGAKS